MEHVNLNGVDIGYAVRGAGEPLLLIHGTTIADAFYPIFADPGLADRYRIITYHRRGYGMSSRSNSPFTMSQEASDARTLLRHLGITKSHIAGYSYGAAIALQCALDMPGEVLSLVLLEPCLIEGKEFWDLIDYLKDLYERGESEKALDLFLSGLMGPEYRQTLNAVLPHDVCEQALADVDTFFQVELPELQRWSFSDGDARRISQPVLAVTGGDSSPIHRGWHNRLRKLIPHAAELIVPNATHALPIMNPRALAEGIVHFLAKHSF